MKHFIYGGARLGEHLKNMAALYGFDSGWEIHFFEPNPYIDPEIALGAASSFGAKGSFHPAAVWIEDASLSLQLQHCETRLGRGNALAPLGSTNKRLRKGGAVQVQAIDFSRFVAGLESEKIVVRLDIEGAEFPVLRKMIEEETISALCDLHVEWHERHLPNESRVTVAELWHAIRDRGVNLFILK